VSNDDAAYLLANASAGAQRRLHLLAEVFDPVTFGHFDTIGVAAGWRCWEVGAGGPTVVAELARRVGPTGRVVATDLDPSHISAPAGVKVLTHDVVSDPPPATDFDLIHARLVLVHVRQRAAALAAMIGALRPRGWLLVEDADPALQPLACVDAAGPAEQLANQLRDGFRQLMADRGADLAFGRTLPRRLRAAGLEQVCADGYFPLTSPAAADLEAATIAQVGDQLVAGGLATPEQLAQHLGHLAQRRIDVTMAPLISAWGIKPDVSAQE
jgi:SAM-dependent methyltransferase